MQITWGINCNRLSLTFFLLCKYSTTVFFLVGRKNTGKCPHVRVCAGSSKFFLNRFSTCLLYIYTHDAFISSLSIANGYISARASPGLLSVSTVSNGNSLGKVVPAKSPPSSPQMVSSRKPDLRVITSQSSKSLMQLVRITHTHICTHTDTAHTLNIQAIICIHHL